MRVTNGLVFNMTRLSFVLLFLLALLGTAAAARKQAPLGGWRSEEPDMKRWLNGQFHAINSISSPFQSLKGGRRLDQVNVIYPQTSDHSSWEDIPLLPMSVVSK